MNEKASPQHREAIIAALSAVREAVQSFAEERYPYDPIRQDAYAIIICEDVGMAGKVGAMCGLGLSGVIAQIRSMASEEKA